jgi:hypothetical protein
MSEMHRRSLGIRVVWFTSVCDAMEVVRVGVAFLCLSKAVASVKVVVEEVKGCMLCEMGCVRRVRAYLHGC